MKIIIKYLKNMGIKEVSMKEEIATTYEEYKNGFKLVAGLGRLSCYQGLDYLEELLEKDKFYSEQLEDTIVFIESHINRIEKENKSLQSQLKQKETLIKKIENIFDDTNNSFSDGCDCRKIEKLLDNKGENK